MGETLDELGEQRCLIAQGLLALGDAPGVKGVKARKFQTLQQIAAKARGRGDQRLSRHLTQPSGDQFLELARVDRNALGIEAHAVAIAEHAFSPILVDQAPDLRQTPTQRTSRVVRDLPQQLAKLLAAKLTRLQAQVRKQSAGLLRRR